MVKDFRFWFSMTLLGLAVLFAVQNVATVEVSFLLWTLKMPRAILMFLVFVAGALFGWIFSKLHTPVQKRHTP